MNIWGNWDNFSINGLIRCLSDSIINSMVYNCFLADTQHDHMFRYRKPSTDLNDEVVKYPLKIYPSLNSSGCHSPRDKLRKNTRSNLCRPVWTTSAHGRTSKFFSTNCIWSSRKICSFLWMHFERPISLGILHKDQNQGAKHHRFSFGYPKHSKMNILANHGTYRCSSCLNKADSYSIFCRINPTLVNYISCSVNDTY